MEIEIVLRNKSHLQETTAIKVVEEYLNAENVLSSISNTIFIKNFDNSNNIQLIDNIDAIIINKNGHTTLEFSNSQWYVYKLCPQSVIQHNEIDADDEQVCLATYLRLPSIELINLWETLHYEDNIKENLLKYAKTLMEFSDKCIDYNTINCNRVILLHGPPGTGKTSLCKALAHKLSIKMQNRYNSSVFIEINSHSLFSKWFSESGKLVLKMFSKVKEIAENPNVLVCVLVDEIESLTHARDQYSNCEPSDAIRVVNAVLTQLDQIKSYKNVLILSTSNLSETIDLAFIDRADIKQYLGPPTIPAIYKIYYSCIKELIQRGIIENEDIAMEEIYINGESNKLSTNSQELLKVCELSVGLSGRILRKIPLIAHALFFNTNSLFDFIHSMKLAVKRELNERKHFTKKQTV